MTWFATKIVSFKTRIESGSLTLRLCRLRDLRALYPFLNSEILPPSETRGKPHSLFSFYRWMKSIFQVVYLIETLETGTPRIIGFLGLYQLELGRRVSVSLHIFYPQDRNRGYGEKALTLLLNLLQENGAAKVVNVEILKNNRPSLRLCRKVGFKLRRVFQHSLLLEKEA